MLYSILISIGFLAAAGIILSLLLIIAEKKILNYGTCNIEINEGEKDIEAKGGSSLLSTLAERQIFIPSACGGRGSCAYCKLKVKRGGGVVGPIEEPYLSTEEKEEGVRLSCQVKVRNDMEIEIPEELFLVKRFTGVLEKKKELTHDIVELRIKLKEPDTIDFVAGQYVQLESEEYKGRDRVMRAYSISSRPSDNHYIELVVRKVPDGICTTWVFEYLNEGDEVVFSGPYGEFRLSSNDTPIIFVAGGSGMAPIWSMLGDMKEKGIKREATYFFGAATKKDVFYMNKLYRLQEEMENFTFIPALSNEPEESDWKGERGLITDVLKKYKPDSSGHEGYLCGSPGMIEACINVLTEGGMPEGNIFYDKFA